MKNKNIEDELVSIRSLMERSSKFISLSGLSGIMAGIYALIGAGIAYHFVYNYSRYSTSKSILICLLTIALAVLIAAMGTGILLSLKKAKKTGQSIWSNTTRSLLFHTAVPLLTGGVFSILIISRGYYGIVAPATLIFYGLALISGSHYTFTDVKYLGLIEIVLGLTAALMPGYGLIFWALGFGVLHIIYGSVMYFKYDR